MLGFAAVIGPGGVVDKAKSDDLAFHLSLTRLLDLFLFMLLRSTYSLRASDCASPASLRQLVRELGGGGGGGTWASPPGDGGRVPPVHNFGGTFPQKSRLLKKIFELFTTNFRFPNISQIK